MRGSSRVLEMFDIFIWVVVLRVRFESLAACKLYINIIFFFFFKESFFPLVELFWGAAAAWTIPMTMQQPGVHCVLRPHWEITNHTWSCWHRLVNNHQSPKAQSVLVCQVNGLRTASTWTPMCERITQPCRSYVGPENLYSKVMLMLLNQVWASRL